MTLCGEVHFVWFPHRFLNDSSEVLKKAYISLHKTTATTTAWSRIKTVSLMAVGLFVACPESNMSDIYHTVKVLFLCKNTS